MVENISIPQGLPQAQTVLKVKEKGNEFIKKSLSQEKFLTDLYIKLKVSDHDYFKREGDNIITTNFITVSQYLLGGSIKISTLHGIKEIKVSPYSDKVEIKNYGVMMKGNHIVNLQIRLPTKLNDEQFKIFEEIKKLNF